MELNKMKSVQWASVTCYMQVKSIRAKNVSASILVFQLRHLQFTLNIYCFLFWIALSK